MFIRINTYVCLYVRAASGTHTYVSIRPARYVDQFKGRRLAVRTRISFSLVDFRVICTIANRVPIKSGLSQSCKLRSARPQRLHDWLDPSQSCNGLHYWQDLRSSKEIAHRSSKEIAHLCDGKASHAYILFMYSLCVLLH